MRSQPFAGAALAIGAAAVMACSGTSASSASPTAPTTVATAPTTTTATTTAPTTTEPTAPTSSGAQAMYALFGNGVTVTLSGSSVVLRTTSVPDHRSPYFGSGHTMYEAPHAGMAPNPHRITTQNLTFTVAASPAAAGSASDTPQGPIGISVNGVVFFNQYAAMRQPLTSEIVSFDRYNGHPSPSDQYHYHFEPISITASSRRRLICVLLDGFPV